MAMISWMFGGCFLDDLMVEIAPMFDIKVKHHPNSNIIIKMTTFEISSPRN
jgi:hypothetical protein